MAGKKTLTFSIMDAPYENGRLQAISAFPDGSPNGYRIVDPRQFILTATFDL